MANKAFCTYICEGAQEEIKQVLDILRELDPKSNEYYWIGEVIYELGVDASKCNCAGEILSYKMKDGILYIRQRTRWCEQKGLREAIQKRFPSIKVYYSCTEHLGGVYYTNSFEHFPIRYYMYANGDIIPFETMQEIADYTTKLVGYHVEAVFESIWNALKKYDEQNEESYHRVTVVRYAE